MSSHPRREPPRKVQEASGPRLAAAGSRLYQVQPPLDAFDPAIHIVEARLGRRVVDLDTRQVAFECVQTDDHLVQLAQDRIVLLPDLAQRPEDKIFGFFRHT